MPQGKKLTSKECVIENDYAIYLSFEAGSAKFWSKNAQMVSISYFNCFHDSYLFHWSSDIKFAFSSRPKYSNLIV